MSRSVCDLQHDWLEKSKRYQGALAHHDAFGVPFEELPLRGLSEEARLELHALQREMERAHQAYLDATRGG